MIILPNGCTCSKITIFPKFWDKQKDTMGIKVWRISYRFHDPVLKAQNLHLNGQLIKVEVGSANFSTWKEKVFGVKVLADAILADLKNGWNPGTKRSTHQEANEAAMMEDGYEISPNACFASALNKALDKLVVEPSSRNDIKSVLKYVNLSITALHYDDIPISEVKRRHVKAVMEHCKLIKATWTNSMHNHYRSYLMIIFKLLVEVEAIEINPVRDISRMKTIIKVKVTLTEKERPLINDLKETNYNFWRFTQIFFHSGSRLTELMRLKCKDVDLDKQTFLLTIKKGKDFTEVRKTIKDSALPHWVEVLKNATPEQFVFAKGLQPGEMAISPAQVSRRWKTHVKNEDKLNIKADFYSLKHLNTSEMVDALDEQDAAKLNSHTTTAMVRKIYDVKAEKRQHDRLKGVNNKL